MVHLKPERTVVLLLSLIALESFFALAQRDLAMHKLKNEVHKSNEEFGGLKSAMVGSPSSRKWVLKGRKMGKYLRHRIHPSRVHHFDGLVSFSSDYHVPKIHPPKNN